MVLLGVLLPDSDGSAVAERLSEAEGEPVVVLTSSHDADELGARLGIARAAGFVPKEQLSAAGAARATFGAA